MGGGAVANMVGKAVQDAQVGGGGVYISAQTEPDQAKMLGMWPSPINGWWWRCVVVGCSHHYQPAFRQSQSGKDGAMPRGHWVSGVQ